MPKFCPAWFLFSVRLAAIAATVSLCIAGTVIATTSAGSYNDEVRATMGLTMILIAGAIFCVWTYYAGPDIFASKGFRSGLEHQYKIVGGTDGTIHERVTADTDVMRSREFSMHASIAWSIGLVAFFFAIILATYRGRNATDWIIACMIATAILLGIIIDFGAEHHMYTKFLWYIHRYSNTSVMETPNL